MICLGLRPPHSPVAFAPDVRVSQGEDLDQHLCVAQYNRGNVGSKFDFITENSTNYICFGSLFGRFVLVKVHDLQGLIKEFGD